ncbi:MAG: hypothetical protein HY941_12800 [Gammaproteobacteria bacterium]|nr:hypothetical protein [Gammaproteobacteria bacterium]
MNTSKTAITLALTAVLGSSGLAVASENPFGMQVLDRGYQVADSHMSEKMPDGKCGANKAEEAKCGANKDAAKAADGKCGANKAATTKAKDGKCGEGKCGANKGKPAADMPQ